MRKYFLISIIMIAIILFFSSCPMGQMPKSWTIMIWLDADNNLDYNGVVDFNEIEDGLAIALSSDPEIMQKLNIIVQIDRYQGSTRRYYMMPDMNLPENTSAFVSLKIGELGEVNMGDAVELRNFIDFSKINFPAYNYMLVLWNHGGGVKAVGATGSTFTSGGGVKNIALDDSSGDSLYTGELTDVLTDYESVDIIGFDACIMGMTEIGYEYRPGEPGKFGADYMVASPPNEGGDGWEYQKILGRFGLAGVDEEGDPLVNAATLSPAELASIVVKEYEDALLDYTAGSPNSMAMGAYDLSKITGVKDALDALAFKLAGEKSDVTSHIQGPISNPTTMYYFNPDPDPPPGYVPEWINNPHFDIYDFAQRIQVDTIHFLPDVNSAAQSLMNAIDECVVYSWGYTVSYPGFIQGKNGLGFFFPGDGTYGGDPYYWYEGWYTSVDLSESLDDEYGNIDFCAPGLPENNGTVDNWRELLESWYDPDNLYTLGSY